MKCFFSVMLNFLKQSHKSSFFGRHVSEKLTFWETVSEEIPKTHFLGDWLQRVSRSKTGYRFLCGLQQVILITLWKWWWWQWQLWWWQITIVIICMMVNMISTTTMMPPTCSSTRVQTISWMFNAEILYLIEFDFITLHEL